MRLLAAGLDFRTAPLAVRERAALGDYGSRQLLRYLVGHSGLAGALTLATCNRTELYVSCPDDGPIGEVVPRLTRYLDPEGRNGVAAGIVVYEGEAAVAHLFRVAAGLESMVVGEAQVLGQVRAAHRLAAEASTLDADLDVIVRRAISAGKRVRSETSLGRARGGLGTAAVELAAERLGGLSERSVLLIGAGRVSSLAAHALSDLGAATTIVSRSGSAARLADEVGARVAAGRSLVELVAESDAVITATTSAHPILDAEGVAAAQRSREHRPLLIIDLAVPRDVDAAAAGIDGVELIDIDGLGTRLGAVSAVEVSAAERIVGAELARLHAILAERESSAPTIRELVGRAEAVREQELARTLARLGGDEELAERLDQMTRSLVSKLLHPAVRHLREVAGDPAAVLRVRDMFDLDADSAER